MPELVNGQWVKGDVASGEIKGGAFHREPTAFLGLITADGAPDVSGKPTWRAEAGRYQLFVSYLCPWASRTLMMRILKGLEDIVPLAVTGCVIGENGWEFAEPQDAGPTLGKVRYLHELYTATKADYSGKVSVPVLWDRHDGRIVNNESSLILRILNSAFDDLTGNRLDFYPQGLRAEIDRWNAPIYEKLNNGVYRAGFARTQDSYEAAVTDVFAMLDTLEAHLRDHRYLAGTCFTEADIRLFVTLVRFDAAYHGAFKCNLRRIEDYPNLSGYVREIYQMDGLANTVKIDQIKQGYYSIASMNPTRIVPLGPDLDFTRPHGREGLADAQGSL